ncbi:hypothetical protein [Xanthomonas bonasiae]|uniref:hypothetical protein n=1 Tax=Xanthomonas bonasiae TaxID=2810351 RepID=UPI00178624D7|nr:hypothetical protein [Xanthomonas surreyensis]MBD7923171.1 hypothetical protein [Xanthomonas surreyensis]
MATPFEIIAEHCARNNKSDCVRDLAFSIYRQQFESLTLDRNPPLDAAALVATEQTLLAPGSLIAHTRSAEEILKKQFDTEAGQLRSRMKRDSFWFAVGSGIVGNIIYSLLLIILFIVAKDQLSSWLSNLAQDKPAVTERSGDSKMP